jgi:hypothetical protein
MSYTLWSHGELLGESALDYVRVFPRLRTGDLHLTAKGLTAFDRIAQTHADCYYAVRRSLEQRGYGARCEEDEATLRADLAAEHDQYQSLALELRAPDGTVILTEDIHVRDTHYLMAIADECEDEEADFGDSGPEGLVDDPADVEELLADFDLEPEPWEQEQPEREPVRFQLHVMLQNEWSIP